ncbi:MAG: capsular biosynthesis protein [Cellvibrionaceae bacterium]|nr:capsular biosynthesis protein [Cellvibrionaceae bacterium]
MIDLHCHILPGIDDGARDLEDALALCKMAAADGIRHMTATPHIHPGRWENTRQSIQPVFEHLQSQLVSENIPLSLAMAGEVRLSAEVLALFANQALPYLGEWEGKQVMLLELPHGNVPPGSDKLAKWLIDRGVLPMIAHPERNKGFAADISRLYPFLEMGCLLQLTAMSICDRFGDYAYETAHTILEQGWATIVASDAHNCESRPPILSEAFGAVAERYGDEMAEQLFVANPGRIAGLSE